MAESDDDVRMGIAYQEAGNWVAALECYTRALARDPKNGEGLFRSGIAHARKGKLEASRELLTRCLVASPRHADAAKALGGVLLALGRHAEAAAALEKACTLSPGSAAAYFDLGTAYAALKQMDLAETAYAKATALNPASAEAHNKLGGLQRRREKLDEAVLSYRSAVKADPRHSLAWYNLAMTLHVQGKSAQALEAYQKTLELEPRNAGAENNMGLVLKAEGRVEEAIEALRRALALKPDYALAMINLGAALQVANRAAESIPVLEAAARLAPKDLRPQSHIGNAYAALNRPTEALAAYDRALRITPGKLDVLYNVALARLVMGDFERGLTDYDTRVGTEAHRRRHPYAAPRWHRGEALKGKTILVYAEQGLGDTIQFVRYIPLLEEMGATLILRVQSSLKTLIAARFPGAVVVSAKDPIPAHHFKCPLLSLPYEFGTRVGTIPAKVPYLRAPEAKVAAWNNVFAQAPGLKVGLVWSGNPRHQFDHNRSIPVAPFSRLTEDVPAHFFAIQKIIRESDLVKLPGLPRINDLSRKIRSFEDTAAIIAALDLVITVDTSVAHLAGALGKKAWVLLGFTPDWRWLLDRADTPWYPSLRLFRQKAVGDWGPVLEEVRSALLYHGGES